MLQPPTAVGALFPYQRRRRLPGVLPKRIGGRANLEGWQMVAGGRSGLRGNDHREAASDGRAPWRGARPSPDCYCLARSGRLRSDESGTPAGVQRICCVVARRSPPPNPRRPPATLLQPFGLTDPECQNSTARWTPRPSNGRATWGTHPAVGGYWGIIQTKTVARTSSPRGRKGSPGNSNGLSGGRVLETRRSGVSCWSR